MKMTGSIFGREISRYIKIFKDNDLTLGYHNHSFEFLNSLMANIQWN